MVKKNRAVRKKRRKSGKGSSFERDICRVLSYWWTGEEGKDVFWRTSNSGGRATVRNRKNKSTSYQHGDVTATDPIGRKLVQVCTIELKRGYSSHTIQEMLDTNPNSETTPEYSKWIQQAIRSHLAAGSFSWAIIARRNRKEPIILIPDPFFQKLVVLKTRINKVTPRLTFIGKTKTFQDKKSKVIHLGRLVAVIGFPLDKFLERVTRKHIRAIALEMKENRSGSSDKRRTVQARSKGSRKGTI